MSEIKNDYKKLIEPMKEKLEVLQRIIKSQGIPVLIIFEGIEATRKGKIINEILVTLDPRGYNVKNYPDPLEQDEFPMKQYLENIPGEGELNIFDTSWYYYIFKEGIRIKKSSNEINKLENSLVKSGMLIIKFFLKISKETQKERYFKIKENPYQNWKITPTAWEENFNYDKIMEKWNEIIENTDEKNSEWNKISCEELDAAKYEIFKTIINKIENHLKDLDKPEKNEELEPIKNKFSLDEIDLSKEIDKEDYKEQLEKLQNKLYNLHYELYTRKIPMIIAYEGWDAAGKGGNIKRVVKEMDPRGYNVVPISSPNDIEKKKHYLWRFWNSTPKKGHITIFDRTWYGRVLVERIENFATENQWKRAYEEINNMEKQWINNGAIVLKFWIHISKNEQLKRFEERQNTPEKQWKLTEDDWRNREKWDEYVEAIEDMISRTSTDYSPWNVVPGNNKYYARIYVLKKIIEAIKEKLYGKD